MFWVRVRLILTEAEVDDRGFYCDWDWEEEEEEDGCWVKFLANLLSVLSPILKPPAA